MGRRSISTTKSGKFMNPTDQARKEARKRELKKNKKQRQMVRAAVLKGKDPHQLITDMEKIDQMEYNVNFPSPLNEKVLKDKRKKMKETWDRVMRLYHKEDPERWDELKRMEMEYESRRFSLIRFYESVKYAQSVQVDDIPLPEAPLDMILPSQIPLPSEMPGFPFLRPQDMMQPSHSILKKKQSSFDPKNYMGSRKPPGVPPGPPPILSDGEEDEEEEEEEDLKNEVNAMEQMDTKEKRQSGKSRRIRFADEQESSENNTTSSKSADQEEEPEEMDAEPISTADIPIPPMPLQPGIGMPSRLPPGPPPMLFRVPMRPAGTGIRMMPPGVPPPQGRPTGLPPGPPPGLPPRLAHIRLPPGPPPGLPPVRLLRPPQIPVAPPPGTKPPAPNVVSAPPSLIPRPSKGSEEEKRSATIEAKPQLRSLSAELTKFLPTTLRIKREDKLRRGPGSKSMMHSGDIGKEMPLASVKASVVGPTKDDTYEQFMKEMSGLL